jgi:hypothetical protein
MARSADPIMDSIGATKIVAPGGSVSSGTGLTVTVLGSIELVAVAGIGSKYGVMVELGRSCSVELRPLTASSTTDLSDSGAGEEWVKRKV